MSQDYFSFGVGSRRRGADEDHGTGPWYLFMVLPAGLASIAHALWQPADPERRGPVFEDENRAGQWFDQDYKSLVPPAAVALVCVTDACRGGREHDGPWYCEGVVVELSLNPCLQEPGQPVRAPGWPELWAAVDECMQGVLNLSPTNAEVKRRAKTSEQIPGDDAGGSPGALPGADEQGRVEGSGPTDLGDPVG